MFFPHRVRPAALLCLLAIAPASAWDETVPDEPAPEPWDGLILAEMRLAFSLFDDFQFGGRLGGESVRMARLGFPVAFFLDLEGRPYRRAVRVRESETLEYQFREHRITFGPGMSVAKPVLNDSIFLMAGAGVGLSFGWYRGTGRSAPVTFPAWLEGGVRFPLENGWHLGLMYQYFPLPSASSHRLNIVIGGRKRAGGAE